MWPLAATLGVRYFIPGRLCNIAFWMDGACLVHAVYGHWHDAAGISAMRGASDVILALTEAMRHYRWRCAVG